MAENSHSFGAYYKRATSPLAVLRLLKERPMYGYEISQAMKKKSGGRVHIQVNDSYGYDAVIRNIEKGSDDGSAPLNAF